MTFCHEPRRKIQKKTYKQYMIYIYIDIDIDIDITISKEKKDIKTKYYTFDSVSGIFLVKEK